MWTNHFRQGINQPWHAFQPIPNASQDLSHLKRSNNSLLQQLLKQLELYIQHVPALSFLMLVGLPLFSHSSAQSIPRLPRYTGKHDLLLVSPASALAHLPCCHPSSISCIVMVMSWPEGHRVTNAPAPGQRCNGCQRLTIRAVVFDIRRVSAGKCQRPCLESGLFQHDVIRGFCSLTPLASSDTWPPQNQQIPLLSPNFSDTGSGRDLKKNRGLTVSKRRL